MPTYEYFSECCDVEWEACVPMDERDSQDCPSCACGDDVKRLLAAPAVMGVAMVDGTRRFDNVRRFRALEKAKKAEKDKAHQKKLQSEINKVTGRSA